MLGTELQSFAAVYICDIGDSSKQSIKVTVPCFQDEVKVDHIVKKICEEKGVKECNSKYFCLLQGGEEPIKRLRPADKVILPLKGLFFQKWCFNLKAEKRLIRSDRAAMELYFEQAKHDIEIGKLKPTPEQQQKLQECLDPEFVAVDQYLSICQKIPGYCTATIHSCILVADKSVKTMSLPSTCLYSANLSRNSLKLTSEFGDTEVVVQWYEVISWKLNPEEKTLTYCLQLKGNQTQSYLPLRSVQCEYMAAITMEIINDIQTEDIDAPSFHVSNIKSLPDGSTLWENILFNHDKVQ